MGISQIKGALFAGLFILILSGFSERNSQQDQSLNQQPLNQQRELLTLAATSKQREAILSYVYQNTKKLNLCNGDLDKNASHELSSIYPLNQSQYLVELLCFMGAYQGNYQYLLYEKKSNNISVKVLTFDHYEINEANKLIKTKDNNLGGLPNYNTRQKQLTVLTKYRGVGDCGSLAKYQWQNNQFKLLEYRIKTNCDGKFVEPEKYQRFYPK